MAMDHLIMMSEKYLYLEKENNISQGHFSLPVEITRSLYLWKYYLRKYFSNYVFLKDMYKNLKEIGIVQDASKLTIFVNLCISKLHSSLH